MQKNEHELSQEKPVAERSAPKSAQVKAIEEELKVTGENLLKTVRELIHEGNYRRIAIRNESGHTLLELPLSVGLVGALLLPIWAAIGAMAAVATGFTILIERPPEETAEKPAAPS